MHRMPKDRAVRAMDAGAIDVVIGTQLVSSYWFYPYICWWLPLVLLGLLLPRRETAQELTPR